MKTKYVCHGLISLYAKFITIRQPNRKITLKNLQVGEKEKEPRAQKINLDDLKKGRHIFCKSASSPLEQILDPPLIAALYKISTRFFTIMGDVLAIELSLMDQFERPHFRMHEGCRYEGCNGIFEKSKIDSN